MLFEDKLILNLLIRHLSAHVCVSFPLTNIGALYPLMLIACMSLPTWWNGFSKYGIQSYEVSSTLHWSFPTELERHYDSNLFQVLILLNVYLVLDTSQIKADVPAKEYGIYWSIHFGEHFVMKLFPDILIFYVAIYTVSFGALAAELFTPLRQVRT
jgi:hypothetical protein